MNQDVRLVLVVREGYAMLTGILEWGPLEGVAPVLGLAFVHVVAGGAVVEEVGLGGWWMMVREG